MAAVIKVLVACHKADPAIRQDDVYMPIHVGKALHPEVNLGFQGDNTGDNISEKNGSYCELTAMYWAWKNLPKDVDIVGLCHYRRYFDFNGKTDITNYASDSLSQFNTGRDVWNIDKILSKKQMIVAPPVVYPMSVFAQYACSHNSEDMRELGRTIERLYPDYVPSFRNVMYNNNKYSQYNMFITRHSVFKSYCAWVFSILEDLEEHIHIENYNDVQKRVYGYMAERLLNVYLYHNNIDIAEIPIAFIGRDEKYSAWRIKASKVRADLVFRLSKNYYNP